MRCSRTGSARVQLRAESNGAWCASARMRYCRTTPIRLVRPMVRVRSAAQRMELQLREPGPPGSRQSLGSSCQKPRAYRIPNRALVTCKLLLGRARPLPRGGGGAAKKPLGTEVLIDLGPVDAISGTRKHPVVPLLSSSVKKAREPGERDRNNAPVGETRAQCILVEGYVNDAFAGSRFRSRHSKPPEAVLRSPESKPRFA
jgi:hypothetical protein